MTSLLLSARVCSAVQTVKSSSPAQHCWQSKRMRRPTRRPSLGQNKAALTLLSLALLPFLPSKQDCPFALVLPAKPLRSWAGQAAARHGLAALGLEHGRGRAVTREQPGRASRE